MIPQVGSTYNILSYQYERMPSHDFSVDFQTGRISGHVDDKEALKQAIFFILNTERYKFLIYSWNYGVELVELIGVHPDIVYAELERYIKEALLQDDRITDVRDFTFSRAKNKVQVDFVVDNIFGEIEVSSEVFI